MGTPEKIWVLYYRSRSLLISNGTLERTKLIMLAKHHIFGKKKQGRNAAHLLLLLHSSLPFLEPVTRVSIFTINSSRWKAAFACTNIRYVP